MGGVQRYVVWDATFIVSLGASTSPIYLVNVCFFPYRGGGPNQVVFVVLGKVTWCFRPVGLNVFYANGHHLKGLPVLFSLLNYGNVVTSARFFPIHVAIRGFATLRR